MYKTQNKAKIYCILELVLYTNAPYKLSLTYILYLVHIFTWWAMIGIEIFDYWRHTVLALTLVKIWTDSAFNEVLIY